MNGGEAILSIIAIAISILAVGISLQQALFNRPRLRVRCNGPTMVFSGEVNDGPFLSIYAYNVGGQPTTISAVSLRPYANRLSFWTNKLEEELALMPSVYSTRMPYLIEPGMQFLCQTFSDREHVIENVFAKRFLTIVIYHSWSDKPKRWRVPRAIRQRLESRWKTTE